MLPPGGGRRTRPHSRHRPGRAPVPWRSIGESFPCIPTPRRAVERRAASSLSIAVPAASREAARRRPGRQQGEDHRGPDPQPQRLPRPAPAAGFDELGRAHRRDAGRRRRSTSRATSATCEATNPNTLFVSAGDVIGATPLVSAIFHDEPTIEAMNLMGLDYNGVGNHEFDEGAAELTRMQEGGCHPVEGCFARRRLRGRRLPVPRRQRHLQGHRRDHLPAVRHP